MSELTVAELQAMATHDLKCWPQFFGPLYERTKTFEIRKNDRGFAVGDILLLREWCPDSMEYTNHWCFRSVTYVTDFPDGLRPGYVCLGLE